MTLLDKEPVKRVDRILKEFDPNQKVIVLNSSARTALEAASSLGCEVGAIVKSLLFKTENSFLLCLVAGDKKASLNKIKKKLDTKSLENINLVELINMRENRGHARCNATGLKYINENEPWKSSEEKAVEVSTTAINCFRVISILLSPVLPTITSRALAVFNEGSNNSFNNIGDYLVDTKINPYKPLLKRLEKAKINEEIEMENSNLINIKDFAKVELRVAKIVKAEGIEEADKLIKLHLDVGDLGERTVFAGIKSAYSTENLNGRHVVLVANLEPRKMKFGVSEGMVLASSDDEGSIYLVSPDEGAKPGQLVK